MLPILLVGCVWIAEEQDADRLDQDDDGVPQPLDCNDNDADVVGLVSPFDTLTCGSVVCGTLPIEVFDPDAPAGTPPTVMEVDPPDEWACDGVLDAGLPLIDVTNCLHPQHSDQLLQLSQREWIFRVDVDTATTVRGTLRTFLMDSGIPRHRVPEHAVLMANRGRVCERDTCEIGLPLADDESSPDLAAVGFTAQPGEPWFVIVSEEGGAFRLSITCELEPGAETGL